MRGELFIILAAGAALSAGARGAEQAQRGFGPSNPFYAPSRLPFEAPPFDRIKDQDYRPAIEAGMRQQLAEIRTIADNPAPATFENTLLPLVKSGRLLDRATQAFNGVTAANTNPALQAAKSALAPQIAAHYDSIHLNPKLFARISAVYDLRESGKLDPESKRLIEVTYDEFVHAGAKLTPADKERLTQLNAEASS